MMAKTIITKKGEISGQVFMYATAAIIVVIILLIAYRGMSGLSERTRQAEIVEIEGQIRGVTNVQTLGFGETKEISLRAPKGVNAVCFVDLAQSEYLMTSDLAQSYPIIADSIEGGVEQNMFMMQENQIVESMYIQDLCFENEPYFKCITVLNGLLKIRAEGMGRCVTIKRTLSSLSITNEKYMDWYTQNKPFFLVHKDFEEDILTLIPIAMWNNLEGGVTSYPLLVYNIPSSSTTSQGKYAETMQKKMEEAGSQNIFHSGPPVNKNAFGHVTDLGLNLGTYWKTYNDIVLVGKGNERSLAAALFASYLIAPIYFVDDESMVTAGFSDALDGKSIYLIDDISIPKDVKDYIDDNKIKHDYFDTDDIITDPDILPYKELSATLIPGQVGGGST